jgi:hypothetical protein
MGRPHHHFRSYCQWKNRLGRGTFPMSRAGPCPTLHAKSPQWMRLSYTLGGGGGVRRKSHAGNFCLGSTRLTKLPSPASRQPHIFFETLMEACAAPFITQELDASTRKLECTMGGGHCLITLGIFVGCLRWDRRVLIASASRSMAHACRKIMPRFVSPTRQQERRSRLIFRVVIRRHASFVVPVGKRTLEEALVDQALVGLES